ncbi:unnamed protein product, partial [Rotaria socialis]
ECLLCFIHPLLEYVPALVLNVRVIVGLFCDSEPTGTAPDVSTEYVMLGPLPEAGLGTKQNIVKHG